MYTVFITFPCLISFVYGGTTSSNSTVQTTSTATFTQASTSSQASTFSQTSAPTQASTPIALPLQCDLSWLGLPECQRTCIYGSAFPIDCATSLCTGVHPAHNASSAEYLGCICGNNMYLATVARCLKRECATSKNGFDFRGVYNALNHSCPYGLVINEYEFVTAALAGVNSGGAGSDGGGGSTNHPSLVNYAMLGPIIGVAAVLVLVAVCAVQRRRRQRALIQLKKRLGLESSSETLAAVGERTGEDVELEARPPSNTEAAVDGDDLPRYTPDLPPRY